MFYKLEISFSSCEFFQVKISNVWMKLSWIFSLLSISIALLSKLWWIFIKKHPKVLHEYCITSNFRFFYDHFEIANYWVRRNHILYYFLYETFQTAKKKLTQIKNLTYFTHFCKFCDTRKKLIYGIFGQTIIIFGACQRFFFLKFKILQGCILNIDVEWIITLSKM